MRLSRRQTFKALFSATALGSLSSARAAGATQPAAATAPDGVCTLFPQADEGPYYFDPHMVRADITEGRPGASVTLSFKLIELGSCKPLPDVRVDIWHADAGGVYSGYPEQGDKQNISTEGKTYLRGTQMTDANGVASFKTIYPGWYPGRTPHIHLKAFLADKTLITGQAYFPDAFSANVYATREPYKARPVADTSNATDGIFQDGAKSGGGIVLALTEAGGDIQAALAVAVDRTAQAARRSGGWFSRLQQMLGLL